MNIFQVILLGIVQGITEWFPISSSGHLVLFQKYFNIQADVFFDMALHIGSLIAILFLFRKDIIKIIKSFFGKEEKSYRNIGLLLILSTIVTGAIVLTFKDQFESLFNSTLTVGIALLITAALLFLTKISKEKRKEVNMINSIFIGLAQGFAFIPGISRSGATISTGMFFGITKEQAARYSFLLFIPTMIASFLIKSYEVSYFNTNIVLGLIISAIVSFLIIKLLLKIIKSNKFHYFAYYCLILGILVILLQ